MRILHVLHTSLPHSCGYSIRSDRILSIQKDMGMEVFAVTSARQPDAAPDCVMDGIHYWRTPSPRLWRSPIREMQLISALAGKVSEVIGRVNPDIVHAHSPVLVGLPAYRVARRAHLPIAYEVRDLWENAWVDHGRFRADSTGYRAARRLESFLIKRADAVVTLCDSLREELEPRRGGPVAVAANGVDPDLFAPVDARAEWVSTWNPQGRRLIGYIGSFQPYEGLETLIGAMPRIVHTTPDAHLLIAGDGPLRTSLEEKVRSLSLSAHVTFTGRVPHDRVREIYALAEVLVYPRVATRTPELTTPLKTLEALSMAKAVLASDLKPLRELVEDGRTGMLFKAGDIEDLASKATAMLADDALRDRLGHQGRRWAISNRRWEDSVAHYGNVYDQVLSARR